MLSGILVFWTLLVAVIVYRIICARDNAQRGKAGYHEDVQPKSDLTDRETRASGTACKMMKHGQ